MIHSIASDANTDQTLGFDRSVAGFAWTSRGTAFYFSAENETQAPVYALSTVKGASPKLLVNGFVGELSASVSGRALAFARSSLSAPAEIFFLADEKSKPMQLTHHADSRLNSVMLSTVEPFWFKSRDTTSVQAMYLPPQA